MKAAITYFIIAIIFGVFIYFSVYQYKSFDFLTASACDSPLEYKLGSLDTRFGLSTEEAKADIQIAGDLWSNRYGKPLFKYSPDAKLSVNFVYDARQALDSKITELNSQIDEKEKTLKQQIEQYKIDSAAFETRLEEFKKTVDKYNQEGGAPPDAYANLVKQRDQLRADADALNARAKELNISTQNFNSDVSILNGDVREFNTVIKGKPEEGIYDPNTDSISIYFATKRNELIHTLAHEFGHSIGMDHINNEDAIMYPNTTETIALTPHDIQELEYVCRDQSKVLYTFNSFHRWLYENTRDIVNKSSSN